MRTFASNLQKGNQIITLEWKLHRKMGRRRERGEEEEGEKCQPHDRRLQALQGENQEHHKPQKCPRCESLNIKFCYYNNYSLSQPRYFCKACRRYWTQGGTLRNIPVGGGCRRGKRPKIWTSSSSSGENLRNIIPPNVISSSPMIKNSIPHQEIIKTGSLASPYFPSGGYVSSFSQPQTFNHSFSLGHETGSSSNLSFLQGGFNVNHLLQSEQQKQRQIQSTQFYQMDEREKIIPSLYSSQPPHWPQPVAGAGVFWTVGNSTAFNIGSRSDNASSSLSSVNPSGWSNTPGYNHDHPPDSTS